MNIITDWITKKSSDGLKAEFWQFIYAPSSYRLRLSAYYLFIRSNTESEFDIKRYWVHNDEWVRRDSKLNALRLSAIDRSHVPMPSGIFSLAQESVLSHLNIDKLKLPKTALDIAVSEFKKHIRYSENIMAE